MSREIEHHIVEGRNHNEPVICLDQPGQGGACHEYALYYGEGKPPVEISFQNGPIQEAGINGISQEQLLSVVIDRLEHFQAGPFACHENEQALHHAKWCLDWLLKRTRDRLKRGVEGKNEK